MTEVPAMAYKKIEVPSFYPFTYSLWAVFALTLFSGIFLMVQYVPTFTQAFSSVERLNEQVPFGWLARRLHAVGGSLLLVLVLTHLLRVFYLGAYKIRPRLAWVLEVSLLCLAAWINFTGFFLPLSQSAFWGAATILSGFSILPWVGGFLVDFIRGGKELGGAALIRFYSMHIGFSALLGLLLFLHHRLWMAQKREAEGHFPLLNLIAVAVVIGLLFGAVTFFPASFTDPLKGAADALANPERISFPWYFLFLPETVPFFSAAYPFSSLLLLAMGALLLVFLPFVDRNPERSLLNRPLALGLGAAFLVVTVYFSLVGTASARYGQRIILPDRPLSDEEARGALVFAEKNCAYCHQLFGREGRRQGPDLTVVKKRLRSRDWIQRFILNARLYQPGTAMPRYEIPLEDLEALSAYLLSLDSPKEKIKAVDRNQFFDVSRYLELQGEGRR